MHFEFVRDAAKAMPLVPEAEKVSSLSVWYCKYQTLSPLSEFRGLRTLKIAGFPDETLDRLRELNQLEWLSILHLPNFTATQRGRFSASSTNRQSQMPTCQSLNRRPNTSIERTSSSRLRLPTAAAHVER